MPILPMLIAAALLCAGQSARALQVEGLYEARVPVADRSEAARRAAAQQALAAVLVKLTGRRELAGDPDTAALRGRAERYLQQYTYELLPPAPEDASGLPQLAARFAFDPRLVSAALEEQGFALWGRERPATLVWLMVESAAVPQRLVGGDDAGPELQALRAGSEARGTPLILPLAGLDEQLAVNGQALADEDLAAVLLASEPYRPDAILTVLLRETAPGAWQADWRFVLGELQERWTGQGADPALLLQEGVDATADRLAAHFARPELQGPEQALQIVVDQVNSLEDYARVLNYLSALDTLSGVSVQTVAPGQVAFALRARGGVAGFEQTVLLGSVLRAVPDAPGRYTVVPR